MLGSVVWQKLVQGQSGGLRSEEILRQRVQRGIGHGLYRQPGRAS